MDVTLIIDGMSVFMDIEFTTATKLEAGSRAIIVFTDTIGTTWGGSEGLSTNCYMIEALLMSGTNYASCSIAGHTATIIDLPESIAGSTIKFRLISSFVGNKTTSEITSITT